MIQLRNLQEAEEAMKEHPHLYLCAFYTAGRPGSCLIASKEEIKLYKVYFMLKEVEAQGVDMTIISIQKIT